MDETIQQQAEACASELPGAYLDHPFGPDWEVYRVCDKVFMLLTTVRGEPIVNVKATPEDSLALRAEYAAITPGYHMNKRHWITLHPGGGLSRKLVEDLVTESYLLVIERSVPKLQWPVDPSTFIRDVQR